MVNLSPLASAASSLVDAAASAAGGLAGARVRRTAQPSIFGVATRGEAMRTLDSAVASRLVRPASVLGRAARANVRGYATAARRTATSKPAAAQPTSAASTASKASAKSTSATSAKTSSSALSFLSDPRLSIEEKLMKLMAYLNDKYEKEMQAKLDELNGGGTGAKASSAGTTKKKGGILGAIGSAVSSVIGKDTAKAITGFLKLPGVKAVLGKIGGPVLAAGATALGFPAAAPILLKYGSKVVDLAADVVSEAASSSGASGATSSGGSSASSSAAGKPNEQMVMLEVQRLMDKQKEMFSMTSNILKASHDTRMAVVNNVR